MATVFIPREDRDSPTPIWQNPLWYNYNLNPYATSALGLPNCTCYAWGRYREVCGNIPEGLCKYSPYVGRTADGCDWVRYTDSKSLTISKTVPVLGAIACWSNASHSKGHVANVEYIYPNGDIRISESGYVQRPLYQDPRNYSTYFWVETCSKDGYGANQFMSGWMTDPDHLYHFEGFIYPTVTPPTVYEWVYRIGVLAGLSLSEQQNNALIIYSVLTNKGWSLNAIAGALGNMTNESTLNPANCEISVPSGSGIDHAGGLGLIQWTDYPPYSGALNPILWYADHVGEDWYNGNIQLDMLHLADDPVIQKCGTNEMRFGWLLPSGYPKSMSWQDYISTDETPEEAAYDFFCGIEMHGYPGEINKMEERQAHAVEWYNFLLGQPIIPTPDPDYQPALAKKMKPWMMVKPYFLRRRF